MFHRSYLNSAPIVLTQFVFSLGDESNVVSIFMDFTILKYSWLSVGILEILMLYQDYRWIHASWVINRTPKNLGKHYLMEGHVKIFLIFSKHHATRKNLQVQSNIFWIT